MIKFSRDTRARRRHDTAILQQALHGALSLPNIEKVAAYEPLLFLDQHGLDSFLGFMQQFDHQLAEGRLGDAIVTTIKGSGTPKSWARIPRALLAPFLSLGMRVEARRVRGDDVPLQDLLPTIHHEIELVKKTEGTLDDYRGVAADVLLLYGSNTHSMFKVTAKALQSVLQHAMCIELPELDHRSVQDYGKPERIAPLLQVFFHPARSQPCHAPP
jgi:hypothetical protein